jgi:hypothetical protein
MSEISSRTAKKTANAQSQRSRALASFAKFLLLNPNLSGRRFRICSLRVAHRTISA